MQPAIFQLKLAVYLAGFATAVASSASTPDFGAIECYLRAEMELNRIPGLSLGVVKDGQVVWTKAYGVSSLATRAPMSPDTPVELASLSKSFTALAVFQLQSEGRLNLERSVASYLPEFRTGAGRASDQITVRHLLEHRSGLTRRDDTLLPCCEQPGESDLVTAVRRLRQVHPRRNPGTAFQYANSNYVLLAAVVEQASGRAFADYMEERVFAPLGMTRTTLHRKQAQAWGLASLHERAWGQMRVSNSRFTGWPGSSQVKSTAGDMTRYLAATMGGSFHGAPRGAGEWESASCAPYCWGWFVQPRAGWLNGEVVLHHTGDIWGGNTAAVLAPRSGLGVVVLLNSGANRAGEIARAVIMRAAGLAGPQAGATPWTKTPDNWAMCFTLAAGVLLAGLLAYLRSAWRELRHGQRTLVWKGERVRAMRAVFLFCLAAYLLYLLLGGSRPPVSHLPQSLKIGIYSLGGVSAALLLATAVLGMAPRSQSKAPAGD